jgi:hypothetical protein
MSSLFPEKEPLSPLAVAGCDLIFLKHRTTPTMAQTTKYVVKIREPH